MRNGNSTWLAFAILAASTAASICGCSDPARTDSTPVPATMETTTGPAAQFAGANGGAVRTIAAGSNLAGGGAAPLGAASPPIAGSAVGAPTAAGTRSEQAAGAGASDAHSHTRDHCAEGYEPQPSDATMNDGPAEFYPPGSMDPKLVDTTVQPEDVRTNAHDMMAGSELARFNGHIC